MRLEKILAGTVVRPHGVHGELRVLPREGDPAFLMGLPRFYVDGTAYVPESVRVHKGFALVKLPGIDTMDAAEALRGRGLYFDRADGGDRPWYDDELLGMEVRDGATGERLGEITAVEPYPASKVLTVKGEHTYLIPAVEDAFLLSVDLDANRMEVRVWEGMAVDAD